MNELLTKPPDEPRCDVVPNEFGDPLDLELMKGFPDVSAGIVDQQVSGVYIEPDRELKAASTELGLSVTAVEIGRKSGQAIKDLGCKACSFVEVCEVSTKLRSNVETGEQIELKLAKTKVARMLLRAPEWLKKARADEIKDTNGHTIDASTPEGKEIIKESVQTIMGVEAASTEDEAGYTSTAALNLAERSEDDEAKMPKTPDEAEQLLLEALAGVKSSEIEGIKVSALKALTPIPSGHLAKDTLLPGVQLSIGEGDTKRIYDVYDASTAINYNGGTPLPEDEGRVLYRKLLNRIVNTGESGLAETHGHIAEAAPKDSMQTEIERWNNNAAGGAPLFEIRKGKTKDRLYVVFEAVKDASDNLEQPSHSRIIILGGHGNSRQAQDNFLDYVN